MIYILLIIYAVLSGILFADNSFCQFSIENTTNTTVTYSITGPKNLGNWSYLQPTGIMMPGQVVNSVEINFVGIKSSELPKGDCKPVEFDIKVNKIENNTESIVGNVWISGLLTHSSDAKSRFIYAKAESESQTAITLNQVNNFYTPQLGINYGEFTVEVK